MQKKMNAIQALNELRQFGKLENSVVNERIDLRLLIDSADEITATLTFSDCYLTEISSQLVEFSKLFTLENCVVDTFDIYATYFLGGFIIRNNVFNDIVPFMHATHGINAAKMTLSGNMFNGFVDFEDSNFSSRVEVIENKFQKGSNLLANMQLAPFITQDSLISDNTGNLKIATDFGTVL